LVNAVALPIRADPGLPILETDQSFSKTTGLRASKQAWAGSTFSSFTTVIPAEAGTQMPRR